MVSKNNQTVVINAVGDIMLAGKVGDRIVQKGADYLFDSVRNVLSQADFTIGNLECPLSHRGEPSIRKDFVFRAPSESARALRKAGINIACLANNHIFDYGPLALFDTISALKQAGIYCVGAGKDLKEACAPLIFRIKDLKIAFFAFTYASNAKRNRPGCCPSNLKFIQKQIKLIRTNADLIIVSIHHGIEYVDYPNRYIMSLFRGAADAGADLVIGHHPHVVQGLETYKGALIAYSLGNFISDYPDMNVRKESYQKTALAYFTPHPPDINDMRTIRSFILQCQLSSKGITDYELFPVKNKKNFQAVIMEEQESQNFLEKVYKISERILHVEDPVFDEMDNLLTKCKTLNLQSISFKDLIMRLPRFRFRHFRLIISFLRAKFF